jgi:hypothetical protein
MLIVFEVFLDSSQIAVCGEVSFKAVLTCGARIIRLLEMMGAAAQTGALCALQVMTWMQLTPMHSLIGRQKARVESLPR